MTEPGALHEVPIKVVPIYFDVPATAPVDTVSPEDATPPERVEHTTLLGTSAVILAALAGVLQGVAIGVASAGDYSSGTVLAYVAIAASITALVGGIAAIALDRGRRLGIVAGALALIANPYLLLGMLRMFATLSG